MSKVINCECGYVVRGDTDEEVVANGRRHIDEAHPEMAGKVDDKDLLAMAEEV